MDRGDLSPQTPQLRQNPGQHTLLAVNLTLLFVASHKNGSLARPPATLRKVSRSRGPR